MNYEIPKIPKDVAAIIEKYQFIAFKQNSPESSVLYWILEEIQETSEYTSAIHWIENHLVEVAIAVTTKRFLIEN